MIAITPPQHGFICQHCLGKNDVKEIEIGREGVATIIRLCSNCRKELIEKIKDDDSEENPY